MARNVDLATLRSRVRWRTDTENETRRFPNAEVNDYINEGVAKFHVQLLRARGQGFSEASTTITTIGGTQTYALPASLMEIVKVFRLINGFEHVMQTYEEFDTEGLSEPVPSASAIDMSYRIVGDNITIRPTPSDVTVINIKYVATAVKLLNDSSTLDGIDGFDEFVVAWAGTRIAIKQRDEVLIGMLKGEQADALEDMKALQPARNAAEPPRMQDVKQCGLTWRRWRRFPQP